MNFADLKRLYRLLGPDGAIAGLLASNIQQEILIEAASKAKLSFPDQIPRNELIEILVRSLDKGPFKPTDELLQMSYDDLVEYFNDVNASSSDLLKVMKELNYKVGAEDKKHLRRFVARQVSETALFSRVATRQDEQRR